MSTKYGYLVVLVCLVLTISCSNSNRRDSYKCLSCNLFLDNPEIKKYNLVHVNVVNGKKKSDVLVSNIEELYYYGCVAIALKEKTYYVIKINSSQAEIIRFTDYIKLEAFFKKNISTVQDLILHRCAGLYDLLVPRADCI